MSALDMRTGMIGDEDAPTLNSIPSTQFGTAERKQPPEYKSEPIAPKLMPMNIDVSSRRNVLPCVGITHHVLLRATSACRGGWGGWLGRLCAVTPTCARGDGGTVAAGAGTASKHDTRSILGSFRLRYSRPTTRDVFSRLGRC